MKIGMLKNKIELLQEDIECVHMYLDDKIIQRKDSKGREYSIVGRIKILEESYQKRIEIKQQEQ